MLIKGLDFIINKSKFKNLNVKKKKKINSRTKLNVPKTRGKKKMQAIKCQKPIVKLLCHVATLFEPRKNNLLCPTKAAALYPLSLKKKKKEKSQLKA